MATFIYNRVPPTKRIPGEPWKSPLARQYSDREAVDLTKLQPFGLTCWVHQKKQIKSLVQVCGKNFCPDFEFETSAINMCFIIH